MSFVRTLATLAVGFAAAKGVDKFKKMGGMAGVKEKLGDNPMEAVTGQMGEMMEKMGVPGGAKGLEDMMSKMGGMAGQAGDQAAAGLGGLMSAFAGAGAAGASGMAGMMDAMTGTSIATDTMEDNAKLMIRAMIQAAKADGEIDAEERKKILDHLDGLDKEEMAFVEEALAAPVDVNALAVDARGQAASQTYAMSVMAVRVDNPAEAQYLNALASALGLSDEERARVHASMGVG